jgi:hypothetical protein
MTHPSTNLVTIPRALTFSTKLFEFNLTEAMTFFEEKNSDPKIDNKMKTGFTKFLDSLNLFLDLQPNTTSIDESSVKIYGSVTLENGAIICATNSYYSKPWFSNVSVRMNSDELFEYDSNSGICYGQVIARFYLILNF